MHNTIHNTMATTLRHHPNLYLHALLYHKSDQRYCKSPHFSLTTLTFIFQYGC
jgi:hypothetical protein